MPGTTAGAVNVMAPALIGAAYTPFSAANAYLGVGDSTTAHAVGQTDLQAATNKLRKAMDATFPTNSSGTLTFRATFVEAEANFAWQEWAVFNASSAGTMLNRRVQSLGTKPSTEQWRLSVTVAVAGA